MWNVYPTNKDKSLLMHVKVSSYLGTVVYACNPSNLGDWGRRSTQDMPGQHSKEKVGWMMVHIKTKKTVCSHTEGNQGIAAGLQRSASSGLPATTTEKTPTCVVDVFIPAPLPPGRISSLLPRLQVFVGCEKGTSSFLRESDPFLSAGTLLLLQTLPYYLFSPRYPSLGCQ